MCHRGPGLRCHALLSPRPAAAAHVGRAPACWALGPPPAPALLPAVTCACRRVLRTPGRGRPCPSCFCLRPAFSWQCRRRPAVGAPGLPQAGSRGLGTRASCCLVFLFQDKASSLVVEALGNALVERGPRGWPCVRCRPSPAGGSLPASLTPQGGRAPGSCPPPWQRVTRACRLGAPVGCTLTGGGRARPDVDPGCEVGPSRVCSSCPARAPVTALWAEGSRRVGLRPAPCHLGFCRCGALGDLTAAGPRGVLQDGGRGRTAVRAEEVDPLLRECDVHHVPRGPQ